MSAARIQVSSPMLRPMQEVDLERVTEIELGAYEFPWSMQIFQDCLRAGYNGWVLTEDGDILGYGLLSAAAGEAHILNVAVDKDRQGRGHGRHIVRRLIDLARWHKVERVFLEVRPSNRNAISLYLDLGFSEIGRRPRYYPAKNGREDAIVMALELETSFPFRDV